MLRLSLRTRIYISMLILIVLSFVVIGAASVYNFQKQNDEYHQQRLQRKEKAVLGSIGHFLPADNKISSTHFSTLFSEEICALAKIHNMDINLFSLGGELLISSNPSLFDQGVLPQRLGPELTTRFAGGATRYVENRPSAAGEFMATYLTLSHQGNPLAILNLPYFGKEYNNRREVGSYLLSLLQVYWILFAGAIVLAYFLSRYIVHSLQTIADRLKDLEFGKENTPIAWRGDDEIGYLVQEYNRMLQEVERSADLLAKSERAGAWREMAKQVAHEIKNPLTPMRLSVQHFGNSFSAETPAKQAQLKGFTETMLQQIDTLTTISTSFAAFAQMPKPSLKRQNLCEALQGLASFFPAAQLQITTDAGEGLQVLLDESHFVRIMNNLINNGLQAVPTDQAPRIKIGLAKEGNDAVISIEDNGAGIAAKIQEQIFEPSFTTKGSGMGMGLAMVRNMVEMHHGKVWFETIPNKGSTFFVALPLDH